MRVLLCFEDVDSMGNIHNRIKSVYPHFKIDCCFDENEVYLHKEGYDVIIMSDLMNKENFFDLIHYLYRLNDQCIIILMSRDFRFYNDAIEQGVDHYIPLDVDEGSFYRLMRKVCKDYYYERVGFFVVRGNRRIPIYPRKIIYIETRQQRIIFKTIDEEFEAYVKDITKIKSELIEHHFIQVHQCFFVNLKYVCSIKKRKLILINHEEIPYSLFYENYIKEEMRKYLLFQH